MSSPLDVQAASTEWRAEIEVEAASSVSSALQRRRRLSASVPSSLDRSHASRANSFSSPNTGKPSPLARSSPHVQDTDTDTDTGVPVHTSVTVADPPKKSALEAVQAISTDIREFAGKSARIDNEAVKRAEAEALEHIRAESKFFFQHSITPSDLAGPTHLLPPTDPAPRRSSKVSFEGVDADQHDVDSGHANGSSASSTDHARVASSQPISGGLGASGASAASSDASPSTKKNHSGSASDTFLGSVGLSAASVGSASRAQRSRRGSVQVKQQGLSRRLSAVGEYGQRTLELAEGGAQETYWAHKKRALRKWYHEKVLWDVYPEDSSVPDRWVIFMERRVPPVFKANYIQLLGLGVSAVISGEFAGWNVGVGSAGYGGFWVATALAALLYASLALCLAEMSTAIPVTGGAFAYCRAVVSSAAAFVIGNSELLEYCMFICLCLVAANDYVSEMLSIDGNTWGPLIMAIYLVWGVVIMTRYNQTSWNIMAALMITCGLQIMAFSIIGAANFDSHMAHGSPSDLVSSTDPCVCETVDETTGECTSAIVTTVCEMEIFHHGISGVLHAVPDAAWWFTGLECLSMASKEMKEPARDTPKSLWTTWLFLFVCALLLTVFNVLVSPGTYILPDSVYPMVDVISSLYGEHLRRPMILYLAPAFLANMLAMLWAAGRQAWALSRTGYLPHWISVTADNKGNVPCRATLVAAAFSYVVAVVIWSFRRDYGADWLGGLAPTSLLLNLVVVSGFIAYMGVGLTFIAFRVKYPDVPRPFRSPLGIPGAVALIVICAATIIVCAAESSAYQITLIFYAVLMAILGLYSVFVGGFHLLPTEDSLMLNWWQANNHEKRIFVYETPPADEVPAAKKAPRRMSVTVARSAPSEQ